MASHGQAGPPPGREIARRLAIKLAEDAARDAVLLHVSESERIAEVEMDANAVAATIATGCSVMRLIERLEYERAIWQAGEIGRAAAERMRGHYAAQARGEADAFGLDYGALLRSWAGACDGSD